jgi:mannose-6-phosphate isomerase-like protein (cupin superfamily)
MIEVFSRAPLEATLEHGDTVASYFMYPMDSLREATQGSHLQFVNEFEVEAGVAIEPHHHNSHEFYYVLSGEADMRVGDLIKRIRPGDLVHTPPNVPHSIRAREGGVRCFCFAVSFQGPGEGHTVVDFDEWEATE